MSKEIICCHFYGGIPPFVLVYHHIQYRKFYCYITLGICHSSESMYSFAYQVNLYDCVYQCVSMSMCIRNVFGQIMFGDFFQMMPFFIF